MAFIFKPTPCWVLKCKRNLLVANGQYVFHPSCSKRIVWNRTVKTSPKWHILCRVGRKTFTQSINQSTSQKGKTNLDFTEARDSEWQWHQLDHMQVCTLLETDNHASTSPLSFLQAGCPSCHPTNSVEALKAIKRHYERLYRSRPDYYTPWLS